MQQVVLRTLLGFHVSKESSKVVRYDKLNGA
jgi:hypothetical protein